MSNSFGGRDENLFLYRFYPGLVQPVRNNPLFQRTWNRRLYIETNAIAENIFAANSKFAENIFAASKVKTKTKKKTTRTNK